MKLDTVVVGGGQAGLAMSHHLRQLGREHLVLERGRVAERWRTQRWDSLRFQSPNWSLQLPGACYAGSDPDGFAHKYEVLRFIERYAQDIGAPMQASTPVTSLRRAAGGGAFELRTPQGAYQARHVVVATGPYQRPRRPAWASALPASVVQLHAGEYRHPAQLPPGAVLVAGSGASGCQIGDELLEAGRRVLLSVGRHRRVPRRYRGRDAFWWRRALGDLDRSVHDTPAAQRAPGPLLSGVHGGYEVDLRASAARGMTLLGRLHGAADGRIAVRDDLEQRLREGDEARRAFIARVDEFVARTGLPVPDAAPCDEAPACPALISPRLLDLRAQGITSVVWATGYDFEFEWIELQGSLDAHGSPVHVDGASPVPGLYFLGLPWLHGARSSFLFGVGEDAARVAAMIEGRDAHRPARHARCRA